MANRRVSLGTFALLLVFGLTAYGGANILAFESLANRVWFGHTNEPTKSALEAVSAWTNTSSVEAAARALVLDIVLSENSRDFAAIEGALNELVIGSPASTATWEALAEVRKARGESMDRVLAAFRMSVLTGSHEGYFMMQRAVFGVKYWNEMPEQDRRTVVRDLLGSFGPDAGAAGLTLRKIMAAKSQIERDEIKAALLASGHATKGLLQELGV
jgi:hypothetical protein